MHISVITWSHSLKLGQLNFCNEWITFIGGFDLVRGIFIQVNTNTYLLLVVFFYLFKTLLSTKAFPEGWCLLIQNGYYYA